MQRWMSVLVAMSVGTAACEEKPAELKIKGPKDSLESRFDVERLPTFTEKRQTLQLRASAYDDQQRYMGVPQGVEWDVADRSVATINPQGLLTILGSGSTDVVVRLEDPPIEGRLPIEVSIIERIRITAPQRPSEGRMKLPMGEKVRFEAEVLNDRGEAVPSHPVVWDSTTYAATIDPNGELEGRAIGYTEVIAEAKGSSHSDSFPVEVTDWPPGKRRR
jgi:hypothetical protein